MKILHQWDSRKQQIRDAFLMYVDGGIFHFILNANNDIGCFLKQAGGLYVSWALIQDENHLLLMTVQYDDQAKSNHAGIIPAEKTLIANIISSLEQSIAGCKTDSPIGVLKEEKEWFEIILQKYFP